MTAVRPLIAGNWKMHGATPALQEARSLAAALEARPAATRVALCPPYTLISRLALALAGSAIEVGAQDCRAEVAGAFTGDVAAEMLIDAGARLVILGHSERRAYHHETNAMVAAKVNGAIRAGLEPIVCVGESQADHRAGAASAVVEEQLRGSLPPGLSGHAFAVAYEPLWAIGSGLTPRESEIEAVHLAIRRQLIALFGPAGEGVPILYGGSVKAANAAAILAVENVDGALVGGASLKAADFIAIISQAQGRL